MNYLHHYTSPLGNMTMASDGKALTGLWFDDQKYFALGIDGNSPETDLSVFHETSHWLDLYFSGICPDFTPKLHLRGTDFQKMVWSILLTIPYGSTRSYREIAEELGKKPKSIDNAIQRIRRKILDLIKKSGGISEA